MGKTGMQPILPVTVPIKKIKDATCQCYSDEVLRYEQIFTIHKKDRNKQFLEVVLNFFTQICCYIHGFILPEVT